MPIRIPSLYGVDKSLFTGKANCLVRWADQEKTGTFHAVLDIARER